MSDHDRINLLETQVAILERNQNNMGEAIQNLMEAVKVLSATIDANRLYNAEAYQRRHDGLVR